MCEFPSNAHRWVALPLYSLLLWRFLPGSAVTIVVTCSSKYNCNSATRLKTLILAGLYYKLGVCVVRSNTFVCAKFVF